MKKKILVLLAAAMTIGLVACGKSQEETKFEAALQGEKLQTSEDSANAGNPWTVTDKQGVLDATGFTMEIPEGATDFNYSYMAEGNLAQLTYAYQGANWVYRIQPTEALTDISGMNYAWTTETTGTVAGLEAEFKGYSEQEEESEYIDDMFFVQVANWFDDAAKVTYSLSVSGKNIDGMDIGVCAENLYIPVQSEGSPE